MRLYPAFVALTLATVALAAQAASAADQPALRAHNPSGQPGSQAVGLRGPHTPVGALVFAAVGSMFLFRRGRPQAGAERD